MLNVAEMSTFPTQLLLLYRHPVIHLQILVDSSTTIYRAPLRPHILPVTPQVFIVTALITKAMSPRMSQVLLAHVSFATNSAFLLGTQ